MAEGKKRRPINCLLMVSTKQPPDPVYEIGQLVHQSASGGDPVFFITTRLIKGLWPGSSRISFYADARLGNVYLGQGVFESFILLNTPRGLEILNNSKLYRTHGTPTRSVGFVELTNVRKEGGIITIDDLNGVMTNGKDLTLDNLPNSPARVQIYYYDKDR